MKKNILMKYYTGDTAEWIRNLWTHLGIKCLVIRDLMY
jgi:hypothetical protein